MARIDELLKTLQQQGGSDLHLAAGLEPRIRRRGSLEPIEGWSVLDDDTLTSMMGELASAAQWHDYQETLDIDFAYSLPGVARFRVNYFSQQNGAAAVLRIIPEEIRSFDDLGIPPSVDRVVHLESGLVLVTGPTGSGKSTTLAAIIDAINESYEKHIVTIEDPIEFVHPNKRALFSQRQIGQHTQSFASALRAAIRQNPDVVLVGEMRDYETISLAMTAAEMGMLVFGTLHTNSAVKTIDRLVDAFPADEQPQARLSLSQSLYGIVAQLLLPTADGAGRVAAHELLFRVQGLSNIIRDDKTGMLHSLIQNNRHEGMQMMDDALMQLVRQNRILPQDAHQKAQDKSAFEAMLPPDGG